MTTVYSTARLKAAMAALGIGAGLVLANVTAPSVQVRRRILAGGVSALLISPKDPSAVAGSALLFHGSAATKETMFALAERLAAAGLRTASIDLPGHGESPRPPSVQSRQRFASLRSRLQRQKHPTNRNRRRRGQEDSAFEASVQAATHAISSDGRTIDIIVGHSMGASKAAALIHRRALQNNPRLFVAVGAAPRLPRNTERNLLVSGRFDEAVPIELLRIVQRRSPRTRIVTLPYSDHALEPYDPGLATTIVAEATQLEILRRVPPLPSTPWIRLAGLGITLSGIALLLIIGAQVKDVVCFARARRGLATVIATLVLGIIVVYALHPWLGVHPTGPRILAYVLNTSVVYGLLALGCAMLRYRSVQHPIRTLSVITLSAIGVAIAATAWNGQPFGALVLTLGWLLIAAAAIWGTYLESILGPGEHATTSAAAVSGYLLASFMPN